MIITDSTPHDGPIPANVAEPISADASVADYERIGWEAGDSCGREFANAYPRTTNADPRKFFPAVMEALDRAVETMKASGGTERQVAAWRRAFMLALDPYTLVWRHIIREVH